MKRKIIQKMSLFIISTSMVLAVETGSLAQMVQNIDVNATQKESKIKNPHGGQVNNNPYYQGEVMTVEHGGGYTYLEIKEQTGKTFWVAVSAAEVKVGDYVRFQMELTTKNFKSKALKRTFEELMFASRLQQRLLREKSTEKSVEKGKIKTH